jgi:methionine-S-sulfoxide reductase
MEGVLKTRVGYAGGKKQSPTYRRIGDHMETIQIDYDPARVSYDRLLEVFFASHDPTWPSPVRQYASAIFTHDETQARLAKEALKKAGNWSRRPVSTELLPYSGFTRAEDYHQKYYLRNTPLLGSQYENRFPGADSFTDSTAVARVNGYLGGNGSFEQLEKELPQLGLSAEAAAALRAFVAKQAGR